MKLSSSPLLLKLLSEHFCAPKGLNFSSLLFLVHPWGCHLHFHYWNYFVKDFGAPKRLNFSRLLFLLYPWNCHLHPSCWNYLVKSFGALKMLNSWSSLSFFSLSSLSNCHLVYYEFLEWNLHVGMMLNFYISSLIHAQIVSYSPQNLNFIVNSLHNHMQKMCSWELVISWIFGTMCPSLKQPSFPCIILFIASFMLPPLSTQ